MLLVNDSSLSLPLDAIAKALNATCKSIRFAAHSVPIQLGKRVITNPGTYEEIRSQTDPLLKEHCSIVIATDLQYDNNYFWDSDTTTVITSFFEWDQLTDLSRNNGLVGFVLSILADEFRKHALRHDENTGCVYDFLWDKSGIDIRLKGGVVCRSCLSEIQASLKENKRRRLEAFDCTAAEGFEDMLHVLDELSVASKREVDILTYWQAKAETSDGFDVFLCHNSKDKPSVRKLYADLVRGGLRPWFDEEHLIPGTAWQDELQKAIPKIRTVAIIVGPNGQGPWQDMELRAFLSEFANRGCRVIPVILSDADSVPELPLFLRQFTWVDFRRSDPSPLERLKWGITGKKG